MARNNFRVIIPRNVDKFIELAGNILTKHDVDDTSSILSALDMDEMDTLYETAKAEHEDAEQKNRNKEAAFEMRNHLIGIEPEQTSNTPGTIRFYMTSIRDFLLGIHKGLEQQLGYWGYTVDDADFGNKKVPLPKTPLQWLKLCKSVLDKHTEDDDESVLEQFDMNELDTLYQEAEEQYALAEKLNREKEAHIQSRNQALGFTPSQRRITPGTLLYYVVSARDVLQGHFRGQEQQLGLWGFTVDRSLPPEPDTPDDGDDGGDDEGGIFSIDGTIQNEALDGLENAEVTITSSFGEETVQTDAAGYYHFEADIEAEETIRIQVEMPGYQSKEYDLNVAPGGSYQQDFTLEIEG